VLFLLSFKYLKDFYFFRLKFVLVGLLFRLVVCFVFRRFLGFYVIFEFSLVPLLALILGWGYQVERVRASYYLFIYTIVGSLPLLFSFFLVFQIFSSLVWEGFQEMVQKSMFRFYFFIIFIFFVSLMVKLPIYLVHLWLPKAHVEAPALGSIVLAAVLLKLRVYAFFRLFFLVSAQVNRTKDFLFSFLLFGSVFSAMICLVQADAKALIAFSSVRHMGLVMVGLFTQRIFALQGVWVIVLAHGFCSSALFFLANFNYERNLRRQLFLVRGQGQRFYFVSLF